MDLGRAVVTSVVLGAVAYVLPRLAYLALEREKVEASTVALSSFFKEQDKKSFVPSPYATEAKITTEPPGMYM